MNIFGQMEKKCAALNLSLYQIILPMSLLDPSVEPLCAASIFFVHINVYAHIAVLKNEMAGAGEGQEPSCWKKWSDARKSDNCLQNTRF